jgi:hypothetical protein
MAIFHVINFTLKQCILISIISKRFFIHYWILKHKQSDTKSINLSTKLARTNSHLQSYTEIAQFKLCYQIWSVSIAYLNIYLTLIFVIQRAQCKNPFSLNCEWGRQRWSWFKPSLTQSLCNSKCKLKRLRSIKPRITVSVVAWTQVIESNSPWASNTFCHILPGHFQMNTSRVASFLLVDIKECPQFSL